MWLFLWWVKGGTRTPCDKFRCDWREGKKKNPLEKRKTLSGVFKESDLWFQKNDKWLAGVFTEVTGKTENKHQEKFETATNISEIAWLLIVCELGNPRSQSYLGQRIGLAIKRGKNAAAIRGSISNQAALHGMFYF